MRPVCSAATNAVLEAPERVEHGTARPARVADQVREQVHRLGRRVVGAARRLVELQHRGLGAVRQPRMAAAPPTRTGTARASTGNPGAPAPAPTSPTPGTAAPAAPPPSTTPARRVPRCPRATGRTHRPASGGRTRPTGRSSRKVRYASGVMSSLAMVRRVGRLPS